MSKIPEKGQIKMSDPRFLFYFGELIYKFFGSKKILTLQHSCTVVLDLLKDLQGLVVSVKQQIVDDKSNDGIDVIFGLLDGYKLQSLPYSFQELYTHESRNNRAPRQM